MPSAHGCGRLEETLQGVSCRKGSNQSPCGDLRDEPPGVIPLAILRQFYFQPVDRVLRSGVRHGGFGGGDRDVRCDARPQHVSYRDSPPVFAAEAARCFGAGFADGFPVFSGSLQGLVCYFQD